MFRVLNTFASVDVPDSFVDETRYAFSSNEPGEGLLVGRAPVDDRLNRLRDERVRRLETAFGSDLQVLRTYETPIPFGAASRADLTTRWHGRSSDAALVLARVSGSTNVLLEYAGPRRDETCATVLDTLAPSAYAGPVRIGTFRAFAGDVSFALPARFSEPSKFVYSGKQMRVTVDLGATVRFVPKEQVYCDEGQPIHVDALPEIEVQGLGRGPLRRWSVRTVELGEPKAIRCAVCRVVHGATVFGVAPESRATEFDAALANFARTLTLG